jgi:radical SAM-linked protein
MKVQRLRVTFARGDVLRYITHLDLMRAWERALKRAALPIAYSEGFTRHSQIAMAAPLPVGATGEGELMDVFLEEIVDPDIFAERLATQTPPGLEVRQVVEVPIAWPSLQSLVREWDWRAQLPAGTDVAALRIAVGEFMARESFPWEQRREKEVKRYDLRALVLSLDVELREEGPALRARLKAEAGGRPEQLAAALGFDAREIRIHRLALVLERPVAVAVEGR